MKKLIFLLIMLLYLAGISFAQLSSEPVLGIPHRAENDLRPLNNYLVVHSSYTLSYGRKPGSANWVFWHLEKADIGEVERNNDFALG